MTGKSFSDRRRARLSGEQNHRCCYCGTETHLDGDGDPDKRATVEHVEPLVTGGANEWSNLAMACSRCNTLRGAVGWLEFFNWKPWKDGTPHSTHIHNELLIKQRAFVKSGQTVILESMGVYCPLLRNAERREAELVLRRFRKSIDSARRDDVLAGQE
jgi:hypothetical protein